MEATVARAVSIIGHLFVLTLFAWPAAGLAQPQARQCTPDGSVVPLAGLDEASGLALSRRAQDRLWTHNDSGQPILFALDSRGTVSGQVRVAGAEVEDWEGIAAGPCGAGSCLYIGDIGDNDAARNRITIYRVPEPERLGGTVAAEVFHATYPDGARNAETLFFAGDRLHIVTKGDTSPVALYRFPAQLQAGVTMRLERVGPGVDKGDARSRVTDGSVSADGRWLVLRTRSVLTFYRAAAVLAGQWRAAATVDLSALSEPQGEGVEFGPGDTVFLAGEGGRKGRPGTFARLSCPAPAR
jgi:hypothetical protein